MNQNDREMPVREIAKLLSISPNAVYAAISHGKVKARDNGEKIVVSLSDYLDFYKSRWQRKDFSQRSDEMTAKELGKFLGVSTQTVYFHIARGKIKTRKEKSQYLIHKAECERFKELRKRKFLENNASQE